MTWTPDTATQSWTAMNFPKESRRDLLLIWSFWGCSIRHPMEWGWVLIISMGRWEIHKFRLKWFVLSLLFHDHFLPKLNRRTTWIDPYKLSITHLFHQPHRICVLVPDEGQYRPVRIPTHLWHSPCFDHLSLHKFRQRKTRLIWCYVDWRVNYRWKHEPKSLVFSSYIFWTSLELAIVTISIEAVWESVKAP